jgi:hypothetical protein
MKKSIVVGVVMAGIAATAAAQDIRITTFSNGRITWTNSVTNTLYLDVEWASAVQGPWTSTWEHLTFMTNTVTGTAEVPMFYRLADTTNSSATVYGDWSYNRQSWVDEGYPDVDHFFLKQTGHRIVGTYWGEDPEDQNKPVVGAIDGTQIVLLITYPGTGWIGVLPGTVQSNGTYMSGTDPMDGDRWWAIRR